MKISSFDKNYRIYRIEQIDFEGILKRYLGKEFKLGAPIVLRRENYAKVAIAKDWPDAEHEYLEISLNAKSAPHYPIIGDFQSFAEGGGFVYKHYVTTECFNVGNKLLISTKLLNTDYRLPSFT